LVTSVRGARGGYRLARDPATISVAELVDALEGPVALTECSSGEGSCEQEPHCAVRVNFQRINDAIRGALAQVTLAEMVAPPRSRYVTLSPQLQAS
jgi:Rrf2 family protein